ncbi:sel1 repeat family protein [bacterium]|nr:sel1 repeat family protein [bacterium]
MDLDQIYGYLATKYGALPDNEEDLSIWCENIFNNGNEEDQKAIVTLYLYNSIPIKNENDFFKWKIRAAKLNFINNLKELRIEFYQGFGNEDDRVFFVEWMTELATVGDIEAQIFLGHIYSAGIGVLKDEDSAFVWYEKAANQNHGGAQLKVGDTFFSKNMYEEAFIWYEKAASNGIKTSYLRLSKMYKMGMGTPQNDEKSKEWYQKALKSIVPTAKKSTK